MKKIYLILLTGLILSLFNVQQVKSQYRYNRFCIELVNPKSESLTWENDSIRFAFEPTNISWKVTIENKTNITNKCIWDESIFVVNKVSSQIIFDDVFQIDRKWTKGQNIIATMGQSIIASNSEVNKYIFPISFIAKKCPVPGFDFPPFRKAGDLNIFPTISPKYFDNDKNQTIRMLFTISSGEVKREYVFLFEVSFWDSKKHTQINKNQSKKIIDEVYGI